MTMPPGLPDRRRVCAVCGHTLDYYGWDDGSPGLGWDHNTYDQNETVIDHIAVPVSPGDVPGVPRCDFCLIGQVAYTVPVESFVVAPGHGSLGDWAACAECGTLIKANKWNLLVHRAWELSPHRNRLPKDMLIGSISMLYANLRTHITGELVPADVSE